MSAENKDDQSAAGINSSMQPNTLHPPEEILRDAYRKYLDTFSAVGFTYSRGIDGTARLPYDLLKETESLVESAVIYGAERREETIFEAAARVLPIAQQEALIRAVKKSKRKDEKSKDE